MSVVITLGKSRYGNPEPTATITTPGLSGRANRAAHLRLAALIEEASEALKAPWIVRVEYGRIELELAEATERETADALAMLHRIAAEENAGCP